MATFSSPPPPPPPAPAIPPAPPKPPRTFTEKSRLKIGGSSTDDRSALLLSIQKGKTLKKTKGSSINDVASLRGGGGLAKRRSETTGGGGCFSEDDVAPRKWLPPR